MLADDGETCQLCGALSNPDQKSYRICLKDLGPAAYRGAARKSAPGPLSGPYDLAGSEDGVRQSDRLIFIGNHRKIGIRVSSKYGGQVPLKVLDPVDQSSENSFISPQALKKCLKSDLDTLGWQTLAESRRFSFSLNKDIEVKNGIACFDCAVSIGGLPRKYREPTLCLKSSKKLLQGQEFDISTFQKAKGGIGRVWRRDKVSFKERLSGDEIEVGIYVKDLIFPTKAPDHISSPQNISECLQESPWAQRIVPKESFNFQEASLEETADPSTKSETLR